MDENVVVTVNCLLIIRDITCFKGLINGSTLKLIDSVVWLFSRYQVNDSPMNVRDILRCTKKTLDEMLFK